MTKALALADYVKQRLRFDGSVFLWRPTGDRSWNQKHADKPAGFIGRDKLLIRLQAHSYRAADLAWLYVHGVMPSSPLAHVNKDLLDINIDNLFETITDTDRWCPGCERWHPLNRFVPKRVVCRSCRTKPVTAWKQANPERWAQHQAKWSDIRRAKSEARRLEREANPIFYGFPEGVLLDPEDAARLGYYKWYITTDGYVVRNDPLGDVIRLHREITNCPPGLVPDHRFGDKLDNRKANLRIITRHANSQNCKRPRHNTSGHIGVSWCVRSRKWEAYGKIKNKKLHVGLYDDLADAAEAALAFREKYYVGFLRERFDPTATPQGQPE